MYKAGYGARFTNWKGKVGMTHDQILEAVSNSFEKSLKKTFLDVVEFHTPFDFKLGNEMFTSCEGCGEAEYPCPTIIVIEKGLL